MDSSDDEVVKVAPLFGLPSFPVVNLVAGLKSEYYQIIDNPKRLPFFLHPIISQEKQYNVDRSRTYFSQAFYFNDEVNVPRRVVFNFDVANCGLGATGGLLIGLATQQYFKMYGRFAQMTSQTWLKNVEAGTATRLQKLAYGSIVTTRVAKRACMGAVLFDLLKRNSEKERNKNDWINPAFAGFVSGAAFGLRGGLHTGVLGAFGMSLCATFQHFFPNLKSL